MKLIKKIVNFLVERSMCYLPIIGSLFIYAIFSSNNLINDFSLAANVLVQSLISINYYFMQNFVESYNIILIENNKVLKELFEEIEDFKNNTKDLPS